MPRDTFRDTFRRQERRETLAAALVLGGIVLAALACLAVALSRPPSATPSQGSGVPMYLHPGGPSPLPLDPATGSLGLPIGG